MVSDGVKRLLLIVLVLGIVGVILFGVVVKVWNDPGDPPRRETPPADVPVTPPPRGEEPVPRVEIVTAGAVAAEKMEGRKMPDFLIAGVPLVAVIVALVELAKQTLGLDSQYAPVAAVGLGMLLAVGVQVSQMFPMFGTWFEVVIMGMVAGLLACGIYSGTKATLGR